MVASLSDGAPISECVECGDANQALFQLLLVDDVKVSENEPQEELDEAGDAQAVDLPVQGDC